MICRRLFADGETHLRRPGNDAIRLRRLVEEETLRHGAFALLHHLPVAGTDGTLPTIVLLGARLRLQGEGMSPCLHLLEKRGIPDMETGHGLPGAKVEEGKVVIIDSGIVAVQVLLVYANTGLRASCYHSNDIT